MDEERQKVISRLVGYASKYLGFTHDGVVLLQTADGEERVEVLKQIVATAGLLEVCAKRVGEEANKGIKEAQGDD